MNSVGKLSKNELIKIFEKWVIDALGTQEYEINQFVNDLIISKNDEPPYQQIIIAFDWIAKVRTMIKESKIEISTKFNKIFIRNKSMEMFFPCKIVG